MKRTFGLATAIIAVLAFGSIAMAKAPKMKPGKTSSPTAAAAMKDNTAKTRTARHRRGRKHRHTTARHSAANMKSSTKTAAIRKS